MRVIKQECPADVRCDYGKGKILNYGWRLVRKGGVVFAYRRLWHSDKLEPYVGQYVAVRSTCYQSIEVDVYKNYPSQKESDFICKLEKGV